MPLSEIDAVQMSDAVNDLAAYINDWAIGKGFWPPDVDRNDGENIALMHSELSEALAALRHQEKLGEGPLMDEHVPDRPNLEVELADCIIRILDFAHARGLDIGGAIIDKMTYNETRSHKHGKKF